MIADDPIPVSALNQYAYCPRRCALIHGEQTFEDNVHTQRGTAEHERVDDSGGVAAGEGMRVERALPVWSDRLGLVGKCDVVEFHKDGTVYPVEYKHGPRRRWLNDDVQLAAQALCLEEMTGKLIAKGAIYHAKSKRRREVTITPELRRAVEKNTMAIREMLAAGEMPPPVNDKRCGECSLKEICQPAAIAARSRLDRLRAELFDTGMD
ncbi:MAG: CRISPR-associated protein Cas4 [Pseudomonadota bacterium]